MQEIAQSILYFWEVMICGTHRLSKNKDVCWKTSEMLLQGSRKEMMAAWGTVTVEIGSGTHQVETPTQQARQRELERLGEQLGWVQPDPSDSCVEATWTTMLPKRGWAKPARTVSQSQLPGPPVSQEGLL